tara:strand:- start:499 stop:972 length:474 start_codon:yes stop_codon:yes gene_type:complete
VADPISLRLAQDTDDALDAYATANGLSRPEAVSTIVSEFLAGQPTTAESTRLRLEAEKMLTAKVLARAAELRGTAFEPEVTRQLFQWIADHHRAQYDRAIGPDATFRNRLNPLLAKRFAAALDATYIEVKNGNPVRKDLPPASGELIKSYTPLRPKS